MKKLSLFLLSVLTSLTMDAQTISGDLNHNGELDVDDITLLIGDYLTGEKEMINTHNIIYGREFVDLGLSVNWATTNIGASLPEAYGNYFAWGEIKPKDTYSWATYKWSNDAGDKFTKYNAAYPDFGEVDGHTVLESKDDAAQIFWGKPWRMPTASEQAELEEKCTWMWEALNGVNGYRVTGPNGHSIFLPAAGYIEDNSLKAEGKEGWYWSSSLCDGVPVHGKCMGFDSGNFWGASFRYLGHCVRAVCPPVQVEITLSETSLEMWTGNASQLTAIVVPYEGSSTLTWTSSDENVATVADGVVTAIAPGSAIITAEVSGSKATCGVTVKRSTGTDNGHAWVDLGLSVNWATMNVGTSWPEGYGGHFAWGETWAKDDFSWETYHHCNGSYNTLTKYNWNPDYGGDQQIYTCDCKTTLELTDDAARKTWGGSWRIPTPEELNELITKCTWTWETLNEVNGYRVVGPSGRSIFLPAAGIGIGKTTNNMGVAGRYWSNTLCEYVPVDACCLDFDSDKVGVNDIGSRDWGSSVRAVCSPTSTNPDVTAYTVNDVSFNMISVKGGRFVMGSSNGDADEAPPHYVTVSDFSMGETEVTQALWTAVMANNPSRFQDSNLPVNMVSWDDCQEFITKLNQLTGKTFRLPTEAEWEFAARGGTKSLSNTYSGSNVIDDVAWYETNGGQKPHQVATKQPNEIGLYDMSGNVLEWCRDKYDNYSYTEQTNPIGSTESSSLYFVLRGGSCFTPASYCRVACRYAYVPNHRSVDIGLRLVLVSPTR